MTGMLVWPQKPLTVAEPVSPDVLTTIQYFFSGSYVFAMCANICGNSCKAKSLKLKKNFEWEI